MALYVGANYHPHDWDKERWRTDVELMKQAGFTTVRLGHLCWDSYEPEEGVYTFEWFDEVMDLFAQAGIGVLLDVSMRPAPVWVHKLCPGCNIVSKDGGMQSSIRRYMEDVADPAYQYYALRFAEVLVKRYHDHPALFAFGLCNELGSGQKSYSEQNRQRFIQWLKRKYGTVEQLNKAWATQRWSRRLTSFDDVAFPENGIATGAPEACLDMRRFFSDGIGEFIIKLKGTVEKYAPGIPHSSNHYAELETLGFDYLKIYTDFVSYPGIGFYPGFQITERYHFMSSNYYHRIAETDKPMWNLEFQSGGQGLLHGPYGALRMNAMLSLLNRGQMILGWTWRSMLAGEEQYLCGIVGHDGLPTVNYREYMEIAAYMDKLQEYAFPYLPVPEIAVAYSFDSNTVIQYGARQYHQTSRQNNVEVHRVFFELNLDYNVIDLRNRKHDYKLLILPEYVLMSEREAEEVRRFVAEGGTVIMTAYSATVDEHSQVFSTPRPGCLADVFGIRVAGFDRTGAEWKDFDEHAKVVEDAKGKRELLKVTVEEDFYIDVEYYEELELHTAEEYASFSDKGTCAVSVNEYGRGRAFYVAAETNTVFLKWLLNRLLPVVGIKGGMDVPEGIQARQIADGQRFYVNTTNKSIAACGCAWFVSR
jgi:Beta-galactosidase